MAALGLAITSFCDSARAQAPPETDIDVVAAYAIDSDTFNLVRYAFSTDSFMVAGPPRTAGGVTITNCESLAYIGQGPAKAFYTVPRSGFPQQLVKIDMLTLEATVFAPKLCPVGRKITGMISAYDSVAGEWYLLAASSEDITSDPNRMESRVLIRIDPLNGTSTIVATQAQLGDGRRFEGLGIDSNGDLWAVGRHWFYRIHQEAGYWVDEIGKTGLDKAEAFEIAFGDSTPSITIPGVDPTWTTNGVFFVADGQTQKFGVLNPATGEFQEWQISGTTSNFVTKDAEGLVLVTLNRDPLYGSFVTFD